MARFNTPKVKPSVSSPIVTERTASSRNHEGAPGFIRDAKSELFLLAVANMVNTKTFYEDGGPRDERYERLVRQVAVEDSGWTGRFLGWLRTDGNMRTAPLVGALEAAKAMLEAKIPGSRQMVSSVLQRADEPGEALAYWMSKYGRKIPKPVKRGVGDAALRLYTEYSLLKYDTSSHSVRFADVLELCHLGDRRGSSQGYRFKGPWQKDLFRYALARRHNRDEIPEVDERLPMILANYALRGAAADLPELLLDTERLRMAGMTWEDVLSLVGSKVDKAKLWAALIPVMNYMGLLRNLRNFDEAGISDFWATHVVARLTDPEQVARSKQFPFRFYAAYKAVGSLRWSHALEQALTASLANIPVLPGRTLVLVDQSPSMFPGSWYSSPQQRSDITNADLSKLFGTAVALRAADATLVCYGNTSVEVPFRRGDIVLRTMEKFQMINGTDTFAAAGAHFARHQRVVIVTDEQNQVSRYGSINEVVPPHIPVYVWNIGGYKVGSTASGFGTRHTFGGLTDAAFKLIPLLEFGKTADWPF